jgi:hypothetical protein
LVLSTEEIRILRQLDDTLAALGVSLYVFGSILHRLDAADIDLLAVCDPSRAAHVKDAVDRTVVGPRIDLTVMAEREAQRSRFLLRFGAIRVSELTA